MHKPMLLKCKMNEDTSNRNSTDLFTPIKTTLKQDIIERISSNKADKQSKFQSPFKQQVLKHQELKALIVSHHNPDNQGYFTYQNWLSLNQALFKKSGRPCEQLWKIFRLINFGQVSIPTGLIHDIITHIKQTNVDNKRKEQIIIQTINAFLLLNDLNCTYRTFRELQNYMSLAEIIEYYCPTSHKISKKPSINLSKGEVFETLYRDAQTRIDKKSIKAILFQQDELNQCTFTPHINMIQDSQTRSNSKSKSCYKIYTQQQSTASNYPPFKSTPFDADRLNKTELKAVKGAQKFVMRNIGSYEQRLRLKRMIQKPVIIKRG